MMLADGKVGMAEDTLVKALAIVERSCPRCAFERAAAQNDLALVRIRQGRFAEADRLLSEVLDIQEKAEAMPAAEIATTLQSLSVVRQKEKRFEDADRLKRRAARLLQSYR